MSRAVVLALVLAACAAKQAAPQDPIQNSGGSTSMQPVEQVPSSGDRDGDGILDNDDMCPDEPEDRDGFEDADGCPELDNDKDGILDPEDQCPNEPEPRDGNQDDDGCPP